jgi:hypothetical protein
MKFTLTNILKSLVFAAFMGITAGGIIRETKYFYQTPREYNYHLTSQTEVSAEQYKKARYSTYQMYYSTSKVFNINVALAGTGMVLVLTLATGGVVNLVKKS